MAQGNGTNSDLLSQRRCLELNAYEADAIFFPGPGGKVNKARAFCAPCPAQAMCLQESIRLDLQGFFAGTTREERDEMEEFVGNLEVIPLAVTVDTFVNIKVRRRAYRRISPHEVPYSYLDEIEPLEEELA